MRKRLFSDDELEFLAAPQSVVVADAATRQDRSLLPQVVRRMERECTATFGDRWTVALQARLLERGGDDVHDEAFLWAARGSFAPFVERYRHMTLAQRLDAVVARLRAAGSTFRVEQDERRFRFVLDPWGSARLWRHAEDWQRSGPVHRDGHRLRYACSGAHDGPDALPMLTGARPLTGFREQLPGFLATEVAFLELVAVEILGQPIAVVGLPKHSGDVATVDVYRRPAGIQDDARERLGLSNAPAADPVDADLVFSDEELRTWETPLSVQVEEAAGHQDWAALGRLSERMDAELVCVKDPVANLRTGLLTYIARTWGEPAVADTFDRSAPFVMSPWLRSFDPDDVRAAIETWGIAFRAHGSTFDATEDDDRVEFTGRLGACGRMWAPATGPEPVRRGRRVEYPCFGVYDPPLDYHVLQEPAPMTHGKHTHPVYSAHCHVFHELYPQRVLGFPLFLEFHPEAATGDIVHVHAKETGRFPAGDLQRARLA